MSISGGDILRTDPHNLDEAHFDVSYQNPYEHVWDEVPGEMLDGGGQGAAESEYYQGLGAYTRSLPPHDPKANETLTGNDLAVNSLRLVGSLAAKHRRLPTTRLTASDRIQNGTLGLLSAVEKYNAAEGKFSNFSGSHIRGTIISAERTGVGVQGENSINYGDLIRKTQTSNFYRIRDAMEWLSDRWGYAVEPEECIGERVKRWDGEYHRITTEEVDEYKANRIVYESTEQLFQDEMAHPVDVDQAQQPEPVALNNTTPVLELLGELPEDQRVIVAAHLGLDGEDSLSLREIGRQLGMLYPGGDVSNEVYALYQDAMKTLAIRMRQQERLARYR